MMILDTTSKTIQVVLGGAVTANQLRVTSNYEDITTTTYVPGSNRVVTNNTTAVTAVASPAASTQRKVLSISVYNKDTADAAVTVQAYDGTNTDELVKVTLDPGDTLYYGNHVGWVVTDSVGRVKTVTGTGSTEPSDGDKGDINVSGSGLTWTIDNGAVTLAKIVDATGQYKIMVRSTAGSGDWEELSSSSNVFSVLQAADYAAIKTLLSLNNVTNVAQLPSSYLDTDGTLAANSDVKVPSQKAVKTYVDTAVTGLLDFKGSTDCSSNPNYPAASKGDAYIVTVAGKIGGASGKSVDVGDIYLATADNAGGTEASVGTSWAVLEHNLVGALLSANNLSDLANTGTARTNLGFSANGSSLVTAADYAAMRVLLGLVIGTNVQASDAELTALAGLVSAADSFPYFTGSGTASLLTIVSAIRTILSSADVATFRSNSGLGTGNTPQFTGIEVGHASDTTLSRNAAGVIAVEGVVIPSVSSTNTLTNKRVTPRTGTTTSSATPTINTDNVDYYSLTAQTVDITSFTTNLSGTPTDGQKLWISITGTAARAITWGSSFEASTIALPTTTVSTNRLDVGFIWNAATSKWRCVGYV